MGRRNWTDSKKLLVSQSDTQRVEARKTSLKHIDYVMSASYSSDLYISHKCVNKDQQEELKIDIAGNLLKEKEKSRF